MRLKKVFLALSIILFLLPANVQAGQKVAENSAQIKKQKKSNKQYLKSGSVFLKRIVIYNFFKKHKSPLAKHTESFVFSCIKYKIDCYILPSIASVESYYGKKYIKKYNNPFGWGRGYHKFESLDKAIDTISKKMKENYIEKGATNLYLIGKKYASDPNWTIKIGKIKNQLERLEKRYSLLLADYVVKYK